MKNEEMAEEYLQSIEGDDCVIITDREERKQAFLAGLMKANEWHYAEENLEKAFKRIEELEKENTEMKADNDARKFAMAMSEKVEKQLRKENATLKHNKETVAHLGNICIEVAKQMLEEAKELLKEWIVCGGMRKFHSSLLDKTETFLKEIEE